MSRKAETERSARAGAMALDPVIHERVRMGVMGALAAARAGLPFTELKGLLSVTDGNLSVHCRQLLEAGYIEQTKAFQDNRPRTTYHISARGRKAFERYLRALQGIIDAARG